MIDDFHIDKFTKMKDRSIDKVHFPSDETFVRCTFVKINIKRLDYRTSLNNLLELFEIGFNPQTEPHAVSGSFLASDSTCDVHQSIPQIPAFLSIRYSHNA